MKLQRFFRLFYVLAFLAIGCCFTAFAEKEFFDYEGKQALILYEFTKHENSDTWKLYACHPILDNTHEKAISSFGRYIRKRCEQEGKKLAEVESEGGLTYTFDWKKDSLTINTNETTRIYFVKEWALVALNRVRENTIKYGTYHFEERLWDYDEGRYAYSMESASTTKWGEKFNKLIIANSNIRTPYGQSDSENAWRKCFIGSHHPNKSKTLVKHIVRDSALMSNEKPVLPYNSLYDDPIYDKWFGRNQNKT